MSINDPSGDGEQPLPETTDNATPAGEQPQAEAQPTAQDIDSIDDLATLSNILWPDEEPPPSAPERREQAEEQPETEEGEPDEGEPDAQPEGEGKRGSPDRISLKALQPEERELMAAAVDLVRQGKASSVKEALKQLTADDEPGEQPPPKQDDEPEQVGEPAEPSAVESLQGEIKQLREQRRKAIADYDREAEAELTELIEDKVMELQAARDAMRDEREARLKAEIRHAEQVATIKAKYADSADPDSAFSQRLTEKVQAARYRKDKVLSDPNYLVILADRVAEEMGVTTQPRTKASPPPKAPVRPIVGGVVPASAPAPQLSREQKIAMIENASLEELEAALWGTQG